MNTIKYYSRTCLYAIGRFLHLAIKGTAVIPKEICEAKKVSGTLDVVEKRTVFVRNLSFDTNETALREAFSKFGTIKYLKLCYDRELERTRGTAFIQFESSESAHQACAESDMFEMDDRRRPTATPTIAHL